MSFRTKSEIIKGIKKAFRTTGGKTYETWEIYFGTDENGKKVRTCRPTKAEAIRHVEEVFRSLDTNGCMMATLKPREVLDAREAKEMLIAAGFSDVSYRQCARAYIEREGKGGASVAVSAMTLGTAYDEYLAMIPPDCDMQRKCVKARVGKWVEAFGRGALLSGVTAKDVCDYVAARGNAVKTRNNARSYIKTFLNWCSNDERKYICANPCSSMKQESEPYSEPEFISVADMVKVTRKVEEKYPDALPYLVLSYWCGIRTAEIERLRDAPDDIVYEEGTVRISKPKGWTKGIRPRIIHVEKNAVAWMEKCDIRSAIVRRTAETMINDVYKAAEDVKVKLCRNCGRHSYQTYLTAKTGNPKFVEAMAGTSAAMRTKNYDGLATKTAGEEYFSIMPT